MAEHRQVGITGTIWNSEDPSNAARYVRSIRFETVSHHPLAKALRSGAFLLPE